MSVPTKTGKEIYQELDKTELGFKRNRLALERWVLLEDHQKEIEKAKEKAVLEDVNFDYYEAEVKAWENVFKEEGWLSPSEAEELRGIIKGLQDVIQGKILTTKEMEKRLFGGS